MRGSSGEGWSHRNLASLHLLAGLPLPPRTRIKQGQSILIGPADGWVGRLVLDLSLSVEEARGFFFGTMAAEGWRPLGDLRGRVHVLTYCRGGRGASIQLEPGLLFGCVATVVLLPSGEDC